MNYGAKLMFKDFPNFALKIILENGQKCLKLAFDFHFKFCKDFDFGSLRKVVEIKKWINFYFCLKT
jgi:hypothetical protein